MNVTFYNFSKRRNSTKQPSGGTSYTCLLKDDTTTARPQIAIKWNGSSAAPASWNYCYISDFHRYYWVDSWAYTDRQWVASCTVDVLATYKTEIGASSKYVLRAESAFSLVTADTLYPVKGTPKTGNVNVSMGWASDLSGGSIIVGIVGVTGIGGAYSAGGVSYYACTPANYMQLVNDLFAENLSEINSESYGSTFGDGFKAFSRNILRSITNPSQFIKSAKWMPVSFSTASAVNLTIAGISTTASLLPISNPIKYDTRFVGGSTLIAPGDYWKAVYPYATVTAYFPPFGTFPIDTKKIGLSQGSMELATEYDCVSGQAHMRLTSYSGGSAGPILIDSCATVAVPLDIAGVAVNTAQSVTSGVGAAVSAYNGDYIGAAAGVANAFQATSPEAVVSGGGYAGIAGIIAPKTIQLVYYEPTDESPAEFGNILCEVKTISSLSGYVKCQDGEIDCPATESEHRELEAFLTGGFFYE